MEIELLHEALALGAIGAALAAALALACDWLETQWPLDRRERGK